LTRDGIAEYIRSHNPNESEKHLHWLIYELCRDKIIRRVSRNQYVLHSECAQKVDYSAIESDEIVAIKEFLEERFPLLDYAVWETYALNEFLNHQLSRGHIFIEVERPLEESVFTALREKTEIPVLLKPSGNDLYLYSGDLTAIVITLTSEAPIRGHEIRIEKLLVDLLANKLVGQIISPGEIPDIFATAFLRYNINHNALFRYARRRGQEQEIKEKVPA